jgi:hypothetical protein
MAGRSSNALTNLAEGAAAGLKGYQARLDKAEAARAKLAEGMDVLEELRRAEAVATGDKKRELTRQIRAVESGANKARVDALTAEAGINSKQAEMVYKVAEDRAAMEKKQAFEAKEKALDRANTLAYADKMMAGRGAGGAGGDKYSDLTAAQRASMVERAYRAWDNMEPSQRRMLEKQGVTEADWVRARTDALMGAATGEPQTRALPPEDQQALNWARSNPNDPRAAQILKRLGAQ